MTKRELLHIYNSGVGTAVRIVQRISSGCWLLLVLLLSSLQLSAQLATSSATQGLPSSLSAEARVSFLAAAPSTEEAYTLYGHAGLRVQDEQQSLDVTFNYGIFDFNEDFIPRFIAGKTDYLVLPMPTAIYLGEYLSRGAVREVLLRTDSAQRAALWQRLLDNIRPEHATYRYNAFRNNCSTRPIDLYLETLPGYDSRLGSLRLEYQQPSDSLELRSWRSVINELEAPAPWLVFGTDLAMGYELDRTMELRELFFIPLTAADLLTKLRVSYPTAAGMRSVLPAEEAHWLGGVESSSLSARQGQTAAARWIQLPTSPEAAFIALLVLSIVHLYYRRQGKRFPGLVEWGLFVLAGLGGSLLCFIVFVSEHPMTYPNMAVLALHPLYLGSALLQLWGTRYWRLRRWLYEAELTLLVLCPVAAWCMGQTLHLAMYPMLLALGLWIVARLLYPPQAPEPTEHEVLYKH